MMKQKNAVYQGERVPKRCPVLRWRGVRMTLFFLSILASTGLRAQSTPWRIEAESEATRVVVRNDTLDITSPKGLSLWWNEPLQAPCTITYRACVVMEGGPCDRVSDLNCFWMASEPRSPEPLQASDASAKAAKPSNAGALSPLRGIGRRGGRFVESYRLQCYYMGYGGNYNSTTRFRRYTGDTLAISDASRRPPILVEYTDSAHLLRPNHWYQVRIEMTSDGRTRYFLDDQLLVDYLDPTPLLHGWFAFRTTWSHTRLTGFKVEGIQSVREGLHSLE
ncbi:MAG: DUF6250 domain-containing protein [Bacteroidales bacterium]|nr:DUF6250 domain-containing protein [Bacteroidales bacterium]